jgi:hypothetical protein
MNVGHVDRYDEEQPSPIRESAFTQARGMAHRDKAEREDSAAGEQSQIDSRSPKPRPEATCCSLQRRL